MVRLPVLAGENFERIVARPFEQIQMLLGVSSHGLGDEHEFFSRFGGRQRAARGLVRKVP